MSATHWRSSVAFVVTLPIQQRPQVYNVSLCRHLKSFLGLRAYDDVFRHANNTHFTLNDFYPQKVPRYAE